MKASWTGREYLIAVPYNAEAVRDTEQSPPSTKVPPLFVPPPPPRPLSGSGKYFPTRFFLPIFWRLFLPGKGLIQV